MLINRLSKNLLCLFNGYLNSDILLELMLLLLMEVNNSLVNYKGLLLVFAQVLFVIYINLLKNHSIYFNIT
jgi:hypothetical protein